MICHAGLDEGGEGGMPAAEMFAKKSFFGYGGEVEAEVEEGKEKVGFGF